MGFELLADASGLTLLTLVGVVGLCLGSFLNVVIHRLPVMMERDWLEQCQDIHENPVTDGGGFPSDQKVSLFLPRSRCPKCGHMVRWHENIPIISWLMLRARCPNCGTRISLRYPIVELLGGLAALHTVMHFGVSIPALLVLVYVLVLVTLSGIDIDTQLLPDSIVIPTLWIGLTANLIGVFESVTLTDAVAGAILGYLPIWAIAVLYKTVTGREGMGLGDAKLLAMIGAWLGWQALPLVILLASITGTVVGVALLLPSRKDSETPIGRMRIPFGPYIAFAGWVAMYFGAEINNWYLGQWSVTPAGL